MKATLVGLLGLFSILAAVGCDGGEPSPEPDVLPGAPKPEAVSPAPAATGWRRIKLKDGEGAAAYELKKKDDGAKLVDPADAEVLRFKLDGTKLKVKGPDDKVFGYVVVRPGELTLKDADQTKELFEVQRGEDGDWKLKDGADRMLLRIKKREYGWEIETPDDARTGKVKSDGGKVSLRDADEKTQYYTKDAVKPLAMAMLGLTPVESFELRAGLMVAVQLLVD
jgi:hypothetical protein